LQATDKDLNEELTYRIIDDTMQVSDNSLRYLLNRKPFDIKGSTLELNFDVQDSNLQGYFTFDIEVSDTGMI
jgi:hypothetical protein